jgi:hypothetical protein
MTRRLDSSDANVPLRPVYFRASSFACSTASSASSVATPRIATYS